MLEQSLFLGVSVNGRRFFENAEDGLLSFGVGFDIGVGHLVDGRVVPGDLDRLAL